MSDDTFIREVNEQMRRERMEGVWKRFGKFVIAGVVLVIVATIGYVVWERQQSARAAADGDRYFAAVDLAAAGDTPGAVAAFQELAADGVGAYPHLARLRIAATLADSGDRAGALAALDEVANSSAPQPLRDVAAVRAGYLLVDDGTPDDVRQRVERLTNESSALRHPAREALGLSLWRAGDGEAARSFFQQISEDLSAPSGIVQRAELMLDVIDGGSALPEPGTPPAEPAPAPAEPAAIQPVPGALEPVVSAPAKAPAGPVDVPAESAPTDPAMTTPLSEQLDLPDAAPEAPADAPSPAEPAAGQSATPPAPTTTGAPAAAPPS